VAAFDSVAETYDAGFGLSPGGRLFRFRLAERVLSGSPRGARILDLGCGTGEDSLWLAAQGFEVHGVDASARMIEVARAKAFRFGSSATFECRSLETLSTSDATFEIILSNFGALNCVPLPTWTTLVPRLLSSSGRGFVVLMGRRPLPEALRRGTGAADRGLSALVPLGDSRLEVYYESARAVRAALAKAVSVTRVEALGCLVPGPGYAAFPSRNPLGFGLLAMAESIARRAPFFRERGDHTLFEFTKP
jgi:SAM-dependent methyltransferase